MCKWTQNDDGQWVTGCGNIFEFFDAGPTENGFAYCPYCGHHLEPESMNEVTNEQEQP